MGNFGRVTEVNGGTQGKGQISEGGALAPVHLGSEFVVTFIIPAVLYVGPEEVDSCIDLRLVFLRMHLEERIKI